MTTLRSGKGLRRLGTGVAAVAILCCAARMNAQQMPIMAPTNTPKTADAAEVKLPEYEVVSVKENKTSDGMMSWSSRPNGFSTVNLSLQNLIANAYGIRQDLISGGPGWMESKGFDVDAKVAGSDVEQLKKLTPRQNASMLQPVLADRFKLKVHLETKELPVYELEVMKGGAKLKLSTPDPPAADPANGEPVEKVKLDPEAHRNGSMTMGPGMFSGYGLSMAAIANQLSYAVEHTVIDKTGLTGKYDVDLKWSPEDGTKQDNGSTETAPSIFTAVQEQLGLKLQSTKGPVQTLVIDHVELPSEN